MSLPLRGSRRWRILLLTIALMVAAFLAATRLFPMRPAVLITYAPLTQAALDGRLDDVKALVGQGVDVNYVQPRAIPSTALSAAAFLNHLDVVRYLLRHGARVDAGSDTALEEAGFANHAALCVLLLHAGANPNRVGASGQTPLMLAAQRGYVCIDAIRVLMRAHANPTIKDSEGRSAIDYARAIHPQTQGIANGRPFDLPPADVAHAQRGKEEVLRVLSGKF